MDAEALANEDEELKKKIVMYYHPLVSYKFKLHSLGLIVTVLLI